MAWHSITLTLSNSDDAGSFENHFLNLGAVAVTYTDAGDEPILEPELNTQPLWSNTNLNALFELDADLDVVKASLINEFGEDSFNILEQGRVEDKVWEREWMAHFEPMRFGERLWICPEEMQIPEDQQSDKNVVVSMDPGLAFGTGTHETTSLCLTWLDGADLQNKSILDYGTGSGILAIAALKLGAENATCLDIDVQAIEACLANALRNNVEKNLIAYLPDDTDWSADDKYDVVLANILASPLITLVHDIHRRVKQGGQIVLSGILQKQSQQVLDVYSEFFNMQEPLVDGDWVCLTGQLKTSSELLGADDHVTHCPKCGESFYINALVLDRANGEVRCGECNTVFFASDYLGAKSDKERSNLLNPVDTGKIPNAHLITGLWLHSKDGLTPVEQGQGLIDIKDLIDPENAQSTDIEQASPELIEADATAAHENKESAGTQESIGEKNQAVTGDDSDSDFPMFDNTLTNIEIPDAIQLHGLDKNVPLELEELEALTEPKKISSKVLWLVLALLGLLALGIQYIHQHRNQLALHPNFGEPLQSLYRNLSLEIEPDWDLDAYMMNASTVALNPENNNELIAGFNLSNTALHPQVFPLIRLSLFNRWGERIAYRDLTAEEYLPNKATLLGPSQEPMLAAHGRVDIRIGLKDPGSEAMDFNVEVCLDKSGTIRCQNRSRK